MFSGLGDCRAGDTIDVDGPEGYHAATVKRCRIGETVAVLSGDGHRGIGTIQSIEGHKSSPTVGVLLEGVEHQSRAQSLEVWTALPKGDRLETMLDQLSQLGVSRWRALECERSERKWASVKPDKLARVLVESAKQCDRAWFMEIGEPITLADALAAPGVVVADAVGVDAASLAVGGTPVVLIGPEGGWSEGERAVMNDRAVPVVRLGGHVLRLETAACAAAAILTNRIRAGGEA